MKMNIHLNTIVLLCVLWANISAISGQYYPLRNNGGYRYGGVESGANNNNGNPFQRAHDNQGVVYERFTDYGSQRRQPYSRGNQNQNQNSFNDRNNDNNDKSDEEFGGDFDGDDDSEINFGSNLDYNDVSGGEGFDPFKYVSDGVGGDIGGDIGGGIGDNLDFNNYFNDDK